MHMLSMSIVTYNNQSEIRNVLKSIFQNSLNDAEVFVVDNASSDTTTAIVESEFPQVNLIKLNNNIGFGAGHNSILGKLNSKYHVCVNPDITLIPGEIEKMIQFMERNEDVSLIGPRVLNEDGTEQFLPKRRPQLRYAIGGFWENRASIFRKWRSEYTMSDEKIEHPIEVDFCSGCFMVFRTDAFKKCGGFDDRYFLYYEDADLTMKMKEFGKTLYVPDFSVIHKWERKSHKFNKATLYMIQSMFKYFWKWRKKG